MPRRPRLHLPGGFYHVTLRGNHSQPIFFADSDRDVLAGFIRDAISRLDAAVHAYCWMTNHIHLLVQVAATPLGDIIHRVASRYARAVQCRLDTTGHLFERRYHASLIDADGYLLEVVRYIHLNPVRAGLVQQPIEYRWSSHAAYLGLRTEPWVTTTFALQMLGHELTAARAAYAEFVKGGLDEPEIPQIGVSGIKETRVLGDESFVRRVTLKRGVLQTPRVGGSLDELIDECCREFAVTRRDLVSESRLRRMTRVRAVIASRALQRNVAGLSAIARALGRDESTIRELTARHADAGEPCDKNSGADPEI